MAEPSASRRATTLLSEATAHPERFALRRQVGGEFEPLHVTQARAALRVLIRNPDLLLDLAIETGALKDLPEERP